MQTTELTNAEIHPVAKTDAKLDTVAWFTPRTDVYETNEALIVVADVPGARDESVNVTFEGETLTLEARIAAHEPQGLKLAHHEYRVGNYRRTFTVHTPVDRDAVTAALADGVLTVTLPKAKEAKVQRIAVKAG